jgi:hypothetical protein
MRDYSEHTHADHRYGVETLITHDGLRVQVKRLPDGARFEVWVNGTDAAAVHATPAVYISSYERALADWATTKRKVVQ